MKKIIMPLLTLVIVAWSFSTVHAQIDLSEHLIIRVIDSAINMGDIINDPEASDDEVIKLVNYSKGLTPS